MAVLGSNTLNHSDNLLIQRAGATKITVTSTGASVTGLLAGTAVVSSDTDTTAGRLLTTAAGPAQAFRRGNILGTVTQSGGVPTGAIIQQGTNANGRFIRYADGTQIAYISQVENRSSSGRISTPLTLPATFVDAGVNPNPATYCAVATTRTSVPETATSISTDNHTTTSLEVRIVRSNSTNTSFRVIVIGRWF